MRADSVESLSNRQIHNDKSSNQSTGVNSNNSNSDNKTQSLQENKEFTEKELAEEVKKSVKDVNEIVEKVKEGLSFQIHEKTETMMVQVVDLKTKEVIKEMPPKEMLDLKARIHDMVGILIDETV
ncbi:MULTISPECIES: flagellar protein FlaG [Halanaerobium]|jgi:flagellar protein FlaG|uniref:Flagellar protein FlaG n=1 Tax=Halanaerobium congolense TaxID=54121 RepID=A0A1G6QH19_9FIRM|nr:MULTISPECIES: flagellar protein FlaG [Halanaerobium]PUU86919.1 MAG: flagellar protein FlaG [Halanaerobium sp.]PUU88912.1 MAG: flagellar protein FlaG [Halanaerobium sp.]SDC90945.1 flagellar protein FlaG [Halanaerobium congolense]